MELNIEGRARKDIFDAALSAGLTGAHIGPSLSMVEIALACLDKMQDGDRFILSKGHGALGYYAAMHQRGKITDEQFATFEQNGGEFPGQPKRSERNGIDYSSGSLGMGLSYAAGLSYANRGSFYYVALGDGELDEGSVWESAGLIKRHRLSNVIALIDHNGLQSEGRTADIVGIDQKAVFQGYGWRVIECDGHDTDELKRSIEAAKSGKDAPAVIFAHTVKGKGVSFMENNNEWHHRQMSREEYNCAMDEIGKRYGLCEE